VGLNLGYVEALFYRSGSEFGDGAAVLVLEIKRDDPEYESDPMAVDLTVPDAASLALLLLSDPEVSDAYEEHRANRALSPLSHTPKSTGEP
jgi:hypothetical protein